jgi:Domain of unknown function (DUF1823)
MVSGKWPQNAAHCASMKRNREMKGISLTPNIAFASLLIVRWSGAFILTTNTAQQNGLLNLASTSTLPLLMPPPYGTRRSAVSVVSMQQQNQGFQKSFLFQASSGEDEKDEPIHVDDAAKKRQEVKPDILAPFPAAADPMYSCRGPVGEKDFVLSRTGGPTDAELSNENMLRIVRSQCSDLEVNALVWKCLGYRFDPESERWNNDNVFPNWKEKYATPPDFIGMRRIYEKEIDQVSLKANQGLVRSVPVESKQSLKTHLKPLGFRGYQYKELTPNKTRRAQCANWLIFYREELFGYTVEELKERRRLKQEKELENNQIGSNENEWKPPVKEVF